MSTAYHPQTDGQTERMNREVEAYLRIYCGSHPEQWAEHLGDLEFSHNQRALANSGRTPFEMIMGYNPPAIPNLAVSSQFPSAEDRLKALRDIRAEALASHELARIRMAEKITRNFQPFTQGQKVWLEAKNLQVGGTYRKLRALREGPFIIEEVLGPLTYRLKLPHGWKIHPVFHASLLSPYQETQTHGPGYAEPPPDLIDGHEEYEPETILRHKKVRGGHLRFLVKWKEYPTSENSWEPEENLLHSKRLLHAYKRRMGLTQDETPPESEDEEDINPEGDDEEMQVACLQLNSPESASSFSTVSSLPSSSTLTTSNSLIAPLLSSSSNIPCWNSSLTTPTTSSGGHTISCATSSSTSLPSSSTILSTFMPPLRTSSPSMRMNPTFPIRFRQLTRTQKVTTRPARIVPPHTIESA